MSGLGKYRSKLKDMLPCSQKEKEYYLSEIEQSLAGDAKSLSYEAIIEQIGTPEEVAATTIQGMDAKEIASSMKKRNRLIRLVAIFIGTFLLIWAVAVTIALIDSMQHKIGKIIESPIIIETTQSP